MSLRLEKVQRSMQHVLGDTIQTLKDPRIGFVTVTAVHVTGDLRHARVTVSVMGTAEEQELTMKGLTSATPHLRAEVGRRLPMRYLPELHFELDDATERAARIEELLHRIHGEQGR